MSITHVYNFVHNMTGCAQLPFPLESCMGTKIRPHSHPPHRIYPYSPLTSEEVHRHSQLSLWRFIPILTHPSRQKILPHHRWYRCPSTFKEYVIRMLLINPKSRVNGIWLQLLMDSFFVHRTTATGPETKAHDIHYVTESIKFKKLQKRN